MWQYLKRISYIICCFFISQKVFLLPLENLINIIRGRIISSRKRRKLPRTPSEIRCERHGRL
jgi:hypothetical protein